MLMTSPDMTPARWKIVALIFCLVMACHTVRAQEREPFAQWVDELRAEALADGISPATLDAALTNVQHLDRVIELDRRQPEGSMTFERYRQRVVNDSRIDQGRELYKKHRRLLDEVALRYKVPAKYIVALWGIETSYGAVTGGFDVIPALATLAYDGRRSSFFRDELLNALKILDEGHVQANDMKGSWAGAMGQNQFMPSSFHAFAVDHDGDDRRDIWQTLPDVFASTANYLSRSGWKDDEKWGRAVRLPDEFDQNLVGTDTRKSLTQWHDLGVRRANGHRLPQIEGFMASVVQPDGPGTDAFLVYDNFRVLLKWNRSTYFATSVGLLADAVGRE